MYAIFSYILWNIKLCISRNLSSETLKMFPYFYRGQKVVKKYAAFPNIIIRHFHKLETLFSRLWLSCKIKFHYCTNVNVFPTSPHEKLINHINFKVGVKIILVQIIIFLDLYLFAKYLDYVTKFYEASRKLYVPVVHQI